MAATKTGMTAFDSSLREHQDATNETESEGGVIEPVSPRTYSTNGITRKRQRGHSERIRGPESVTMLQIPCNLTCLYLFNNYLKLFKIKLVENGGLRPPR